MRFTGICLARVFSCFSGNNSRHMRPMAVVIDGIRGVVLHHRGPDFRVVALTSLFVGAMLIVAYGIFTKAEERFADAI